MSWQQQLESILAEGVAQAQQRERSAFDEFAGAFAGSIVLYGAGNLGRKVLLGLRSHNIEPLAFADGNPILAGKTVEGIPVFSPSEAARRFGKNSVFVVCVWHPDRQHGVQHIMENLSSLGAERVSSFVPLFWKYSQVFLPYFFWDLPSKLLAEADVIEKACSALAEDASKSDFVNHLRLRSRGDFVCSPAPSPLPAYFPADLFGLRTDECFIDCGAFDGDTIREFLKQSEGAFRRVVAFEPDPHNLEALQKTLAADDLLRNRAVVHNCAVGASRGTVRFAATGLDNAAVSTDGELQVDCTTLDHALEGEEPTFIKMDIEGSEHAALSGGQRTIRDTKPVLAVSVYHLPSDLWALPLFMHELEPESRLNLRMYWRDGWDLVCFAVPPSRAVRK